MITADQIKSINNDLWDTSGTGLVVSTPNIDRFADRVTAAKPGEVIVVSAALGIGKTAMVQNLLNKGYDAARTSIFNTKWPPKNLSNKILIIEEWDRKAPFEIMRKKAVQAADLISRNPNNVYILTGDNCIQNPQIIGVIAPNCDFFEADPFSEGVFLELTKRRAEEYGLSDLNLTEITDPAIYSTIVDSKDYRSSMVIFDGLIHNMKIGGSPAHIGKNEVLALGFLHSWIKNRGLLELITKDPSRFKKPLTLQEMADLNLVKYLNNFVPLGIPTPRKENGINHWKTPEPYLLGQGHVLAAMFVEELQALEDMYQSCEAHPDRRSRPIVRNVYINTDMSLSEAINLTFDGARDREYREISGPIIAKLKEKARMQ